MAPPCRQTIQSDLKSGNLKQHTGFPEAADMVIADSGYISCSVVADDRKK